ELADRLHGRDVRGSDQEPRAAKVHVFGTVAPGRTVVRARCGVSRQPGALRIPCLDVSTLVSSAAHSSPAILRDSSSEMLWRLRSCEESGQEVAEQDECEQPDRPAVAVDEEVPVRDQEATLVE